MNLLHDTQAGSATDVTDDDIDRLLAEAPTEAVLRPTTSQLGWRE